MLGWSDNLHLFNIILSSLHELSSVRIKLNTHLAICPGSTLTILNEWILIMIQISLSMGHLCNIFTIDHPSHAMTLYLYTGMYCVFFICKPHNALIIMVRLLTVSNSLYVLLFLTLLILEIHTDITSLMEVSHISNNIMSYMHSSDCI